MNQSVGYEKVLMRPTGVGFSDLPEKKGLKTDRRTRVSKKMIKGYGWEPSCLDNIKVELVLQGQCCPFDSGKLAMGLLYKRHMMP